MIAKDLLKDEKIITHCQKIARRINYELRQDVAQTAFVRLLEEEERYDGLTEFYRAFWLFAKRASDNLQYQIDKTDEYIDEVVSVVDVDIIDCIEALTPGLRVIALLYYQGYKTAEIANKLSLSYAQIQRRKMKIRKELV